MNKDTLMEEELGFEIKYPFRIGVEKIEFFDEAIREEFFKEENFDEIYNIFLVEFNVLPIVRTKMLGF